MPSVKQLEKEKILFYTHLFAHTKIVGGRVGLKKAFEMLSEKLSGKRAQWFEENKSKFNLKQKNARTARKIVLEFWRQLTPSWSKKNFCIHEESGHVSIFRFKGFCPILEASKRNNLDTELSCTFCSEKPFNAAIKKFDKKTELKIMARRPEIDYCEYLIAFRPEKVNKTVTVFLRHKGKILLLKRSSNKHIHHPNEWNTVTGYLNEMSALKRAYLEIKEETGIKKNQLKFIKKEKEFKINDRICNKIWLCTPVLFETKTRKIELNYEHLKYKWIKPEELNKLKYIVGLQKALNKVLSP
ncbi:MAG: NUDIX domain-containing protein [Candidatus Diapherotrites archaeon]